MDYATILAHAPLAAHMPEATLRRMVGLADALHLQSGDTLYSKGEPADYFYVVANGRLRVTDGATLVGHVGFGEPVGEAGAISGEARHASVRAARDSVVLRLPREVFLKFLSEHASAAVALSRRLVVRLRQTERERQLAAAQGQTTLAILAASPGAPVMALTETLTRGLQGYPTVRVINVAHVEATFGPGRAQAPYEDEAATRRFNEWFCQLERRHTHVIFVAERNDTPWALRCLRQADRVLALAEAGATPTVMPALEAGRAPDTTPLAPVELVLLRPEGDPSPHTFDWRQATGARAHYYVHPWDAQDLAALQRQISGRGIGLVLGGGGARGFAHIGLIRALEQLEIPVDVCGGTSMGAFISALVACGYDSVEMTQIARETFVENNYLNDYTLPRVSLIKARRFLRRLKEIFAERRIEELRRTYYCISTNLSTGAAMVHDSGPLAEWVGTSMAVPGVAPPIAWHGDLLCDGGVVNNLPTDVMQSLERGRIIACSVSTAGDIRLPGRGTDAPEPDALLRKLPTGTATPVGHAPRFTEILMRSATLAADTTIAQAALALADVALKMPVDDFGMFDWNGLDALVEIGYKTAMEQLGPRREELVTLLQAAA